MLAVCLTAGMVASAASLPLQASSLGAQTTNEAMCDRDVTLSPVEVLGITVSVTVSDISTDCFDWTLKVQVTNSLNSPIAGGALSTVVDQTTESFLSLSLGGIPGPNGYFWTLQPP